MLFIISTYSAMVIYFFMGIYVYYLDHRARINRLLILVCLLFVISAFAELLAYNLDDENLVLLCTQISQLGMLNYSGLMLMMTLILTHKEYLLDKYWKRFLIYFPGIFCSLYQIVWLGILRQTDYLLQTLESFENFYIYLNVILALALVLYWKKTTKLNREKEIARIILIFALITFVLITVNDFIINKNASNTSIDQILLLILVFSIWYANREYRFLDITALISANDIVDKITDLVFLADDKGLILRANDRAKAVLEKEGDKLVGKSLMEIANIDFSPIMNGLRQNPKQVFEMDGDIYCHTKQGHNIPINIYASAVRDNVGEIAGIVVVLQDKTVLKQLQNEIKERTSKEQQLYYLSIHDSLTGLYNRTYFEQMMSRFQKEQPESLGVVICDVDGLKFTNDTLGHNQGDKLLIRTARIIKKQLKNNEMSFRIGGDEFAVFVQGTSKEAMGELCNALRGSIDKYNFENPEKIIHISIGYSFSMEKDKKVKDLFKEVMIICIYRN
jgi:diguanylate cyclase (GGDEF)-like protein/PAS domain S-box-containing protein